MELIRGVEALRLEHSPSVVSIGNFDGVHLGHQSVIRALMTQAEKTSAAATVISFEPLAREYFQPQAPLRLSSIEHRADLLAQLGVRRVLCIDFNPTFVNISPEAFVVNVLVNGLGVQYLSVGDDFVFGKNRAGDFSTLLALSKQYNFEVKKHGTYLMDKERVSSERIRKALLKNDFSLAKRMLGRDFSIQGIVLKGQQLGRTIGFPTANIPFTYNFRTLQGVFAVSCDIDDSSVLGVANIGIRPTVNGQENRLEVHFFGMDKNLYGRVLDVKIHYKIRDERRFTSVSELAKQIEQDVFMAKRYFGV